MKNRTKATVFCLSFLAGCAIIPAAQAGGVNLGMLRGEVVKILDSLGITTGGVYTAGGFSNPATEDLDMDGNDILADGLIQVGGTTSTYPALRYGSSAGVIGLLRADGTPGQVVLQGATGAGTDAGSNVVIRGGATTTNHNDYSRVTLGGETGSGVGGSVSLVGGPGVAGQDGGIVSMTGGQGNSGAVAGGAVLCDPGSGAGVAGGVRVIGALYGNRANVVAIVTGVGSETLLTAAQSGSLVTNTGTTVKAACTLPASPTVGTFYDFLCDDADGFRIVANTSQTITLGALGASASAGYVETVRQESAFRLTYTATNVWRGSKIEGTWRKDSTTVAGFAFTPTAWASFDPESTGMGWSGANVSATGHYQHDGAEVKVRFAVTCSGAPGGSATLAFAPPLGTVDGTAVNDGTLDLTPIGQAVAFDSGATVTHYPIVWGSGGGYGDKALVQITTAPAFLTNAAPIAFGASDEVIGHFSYPVVQ